MTSGAVSTLTLAMDESGTWPGRRCRWQARGQIDRVEPGKRGLQRGRASRITRYWFDWVKMVEMMRWPKAS